MKPEHHNPIDDLPPAAAPNPPPDAATTGAHAPAGEAAFESPDPRVLDLWRVHMLIDSIWMLGGALGAGVFAAFRFDLSWRWVLGPWLALVLLRVAWFLYLPSRAYRATGYRLDDRVLETRHGIWFRNITLLPLSRVQHVDLSSGPLERMFGLASLTLYTAGTHEAEVAIRGLSTARAAQLRDQLVALGGVHAR